MKRTIVIACLGLLVATAATAARAADGPEPFPGVTPPTGAPPPWREGRWLDFDAVVQSLLVYRSDADFDPTAPYYDPDGQSVGLLGTFLKPRVRLVPIDELAIVYELELGLNLWSLHDPDSYEARRVDAFRMAHRELFAEGRLFDGLFAFKVGYQYYTDPTALFLGHWIGAAVLGSDLGSVRLSASVGQLPDQTFEGVTLDANNFAHDSLAYGLRADVPLDEWTLSVAVHGLHDTRVVGQPLDLVTASVRAAAEYEDVQLGLDAAFQWGVTRNGAEGGDETTLAWAGQAFARWQPGRFALTFSQLLLSPDDGHVGNDRNGAFFYSGKTRSPTLFLSEDEIRDRGTNYDERLAERRGKFYLVRPGFSLTDLSVAYAVTTWFVPSLTVGAAFVLESDNALGESFAAIETTLDLELRYRDVLSFHVVGGLVAPGGALAAFVNLSDRTATEPQFTLESSLFVYF